MPPMFMAREVGRSLKMVGRLKGLVCRQSPTIADAANTSKPTKADCQHQLPPPADYPPRVPTMRSTDDMVLHCASPFTGPAHTRPGSTLKIEGLRIEPQDAAMRFLRWTAEHGLAREWTVDAIWFLAERDFAPVHGYILPARRVFLGALQRQPGVSVTYDRRVYNRDGRMICKTTFYLLPTRDKAVDV